VQKALNIVRHKYDVPPLDIHLLKKIPTGAGLGGGSSDGAFMINALDYYFHFGIPENERLEMAASLGSDCAFFIKNTPSFATGRGEVFSEISMPDNLNIVIVKPEVSISTPMAYAKVKPQTPKYSLKESVQKPVSQWKDLVKNDFEEFLFPDFPLLGAIKQQLYESGAVYASMTGSGSALFGIFDHEPLLSEQLNKIRIL